VVRLPGAIHLRVRQPVPQPQTTQDRLSALVVGAATHHAQRDVVLGAPTQHRAHLRIQRQDARETSQPVLAQHRARIHGRGCGGARQTHIWRQRLLSEE
jgi:hypothetical protein